MFTIEEGWVVQRALEKGEFTEDTRALFGV